MVRRKISQSKDFRTCVYIPAFLRDHFELKAGDEVDVDIDNNRIVITPLKKEDIENASNHNYDPEPAPVA